VSRRDVSFRIKEKLEKQMTKLQRRLAEMSTSDELEDELEQVEAEIAQIKSEMQQGTADELGLGVYERLEGHLDRLLAKKERIELKIEILEEKRERFQETLEELKLAYEQHLPGSDSTDTPTDSRAMWGSDSVKPPRPSKQMEEERRKILEMLREGKITVDDATRLLNALGEKEEKVRRRQRPRWVRIRVTDTTTGCVRVNLTLPIGLVKAGLRAGGSIAGIEGLDTADLEDLLNRGEAGHFFDAHDKNGGERVEISVE